MSKSILLYLIPLFLFCQCKNNCADIYDPVCGNDGQNYRNPCHANTLRVSYTEGLCKYTKQGKVIYLGDNCGWVFKTDFSLKNEMSPDVYFQMSNFPDDFKKEGLNVEIIYTNISDAIGGCMVEEELVYLIHISVVELQKV
ncbi:MAG: Kazal-type serine protease inhibitor family protein [Saprospiraceae bacterium]